MSVLSYLEGSKTEWVWQPGCIILQVPIFLYTTGYIIAVIGPPTVQSMIPNCSEKDISVLYRKLNCMKCIWPQTVYNRKYCISVMGPPAVQSIRANCLEKDISVLKEPQLFKAWPKTVQKRIYQYTGNPTVWSAYGPKLFLMGNISVIGPPTVQSIRANCLEKDISVLKEPQLFKAWPKTVQKRIYQYYTGNPTVWSTYDSKLFIKGYISAIGPQTIQIMAQNCFEKDTSFAIGPQLFKALKPNCLENDI